MSTDPEALREKIEALRRAGLTEGVRPDPGRRADALTGALEAELMAERAAAYGRAVRKVEHAVAALTAASGALASAPERDVPAIRAEWATRRAAALEARWELAVHRDALGLVAQPPVEQEYPIPGRPPR